MTKLQQYYECATGRSIKKESVDTVKADQMFAIAKKSMDPVFQGTVIKRKRDRSVQLKVTTIASSLYKRINPPSNDRLLKKRKSGKTCRITIDSVT